MSDLVDFLVDFGPLIVIFFVVIGFTVITTWILARRNAKAEQRVSDEAEWDKEVAIRFHSN